MASTAPRPIAEVQDERGLYTWFVDRPVLTLMAAMAIIVVGLVSFSKLPLRFVPEGLSSNEINIWVPVPTDRTPTEVEDRIVVPFEQQLRTIPGLKEIEAESGAGSARLTVTLDEGMDSALAAAEIRDRAQRARLSWPEGVDRYVTWREDASAIPLAFFQMLTPERSPDWDFLIDRVVRPRLEAVDGVGRVDVWGLLDETIRIWFDRDKLVAHRIDYGQLLQRMAADNFTAPVGELEDGPHRYLIRVDTKFVSLADVEEYPIKPGLVLRDIARVERVPSVRDQLSRFNQRYTYTGFISAAAGANPVEASARLRRATAALAEDTRLDGLSFRFLLDQGEMITDSLDTLLTTSLQGGVLALVVLLLFLRNLRFTLAIATAIPMALLLVGGWLFFAGESLNILSMCGMTLAVGMVVDNSVVVLESIRRLRERGLPLRQACVQGAREVGLAVSMATLTTVVVILPMVFLGNAQARTMLGSVGVPLSVALIGSLAVALLLLPSGIYHLGGAGVKRAAVPAGAASHWLSPIAWLLRFNHALLRIALRHRLLASASALLLLSTCGEAWQRLEFSGGGINPFRSGDVSIKMRLPRGLELVDVEREVLAYEEFVLARKEEWKVDTVSSRFSRRSASVDIGFAERLPKDEFDALRKRIEDEWPRRPGTELILAQRSSGGGGGGGSGGESGDRNFVLRLYGRDSQELIDLAVGVQSMLVRLPEVAKVEIPQLEDNDEVTVRMDRDRMQALAVSPDALFGSVASGLQGQLLAEFEERGRETQLIAQLDSEEHPTIVDLKETQIYSGHGSFQSLATMVDIEFEPAMGEIERADGRTHVTLVGQREDGVGPLQFSRVLADAMASIPLPRGYGWEERSQFVDSREQVFALMDALYLGITLVFLLMGVLFESVILPGAIMFTVPFAILGAMWSLVLFLGTFDPMAVVGVILLAGIVVNNGIVLLDCIARLRQEMDREAAILEGTRRRLRPIVMTAMTTIAGLLPMAVFGDSEGSGLSYVGMSVAVAGGLAVCTVFTAFVVPLMYTFMDDLTVWGRRVWLAARHA